VTGADYIKPAPVGNFRGVWEELPPESEREDDYGLGHRENLQVGGQVHPTVICPAAELELPALLAWD